MVFFFLTEMCKNMLTILVTLHFSKLREQMIKMTGNIHIPLTTRLAVVFLPLVTHQNSPASSS